MRDTIRAIENIAVDSAASEFAVQASEYVSLAGWQQRVPPLWGHALHGRYRVQGSACTPAGSVQWTFSSVKIYDENNQPVKDDSSPKRSPISIILAQVNGQWKMVNPRFPNSPDC